MQAKLADNLSLYCGDKKRSGKLNIKLNGLTEPL